MSDPKPVSGKEPAALQSTRQMLDELDALMDRMLALPVNDLDEAMAAPREIVRMPTVSATLTVLEAPGADSALSPVTEAPPFEPVHFPGYSTNPPSIPALRSPQESGQVANLSYELASIPALRSPEEFGQVANLSHDMVSQEVIPPPVIELPVTVTEPIPAIRPIRMPGRSLSSRFLLPALWFNQGFDKMTILLGEPGRWLRGRRGRRLMGLTGLGLLGLAGLWVIKDLLGWTW